MASKNHNEHHKYIKLSTHDILLFGTPHRGVYNVPWGKPPVNMVAIYWHTNSGLLEHLEKNSEALELQLKQNRAISADFPTKFCYKTFPTPPKAGFSAMVGHCRPTPYSIPMF
jgi:hypothetical protein